MLTRLYDIDQDINSEGYSLGSVSPAFEIHKIHFEEGNGPNHGVPCFTNEKFPNQPNKNLLLMNRPWCTASLFVEI